MSQRVVVDLQCHYETELAHWHHAALAPHKLQNPKCSAASIRTGRPLMDIMTQFGLLLVVLNVLLVGGKSLLLKFKP